VSFSEVQDAVKMWSPEDQDRLAAFLTVLRLRRDPAYMDEIDRRLRDKDPANWMALKEVKTQLKDH
jgi:hypothetical protein